MKTLRGYEAIQVADSYDVLLYDRNYKTEVTLQQVREFVLGGRDPESFSIENWPSTDKEAEHIVYNEFTRMLTEQKSAESTISNILSRLSSQEAIHERAAELAAERLCDQGRLIEINDHSGEYTYRLPRTFHFTQAFLDGVRNHVCDACAQLNLSGPFHESCLMALIDVLTNDKIMQSDIVEERQIEENLGKSVKSHRPNLDIQWLSKKASEAKSRVQSVFRPFFAKDHDEPEEFAHSIAPEETTIAKTIPVEPSVPKVDLEAVEEMEGNEESLAGSEDGRVQITKEELIRYIRNVEIIDRNGELTQLQRERMSLQNQLSAKDREIQQMERQHQYLIQQCEEMQHDMDTLIEAMQIAKRRSQSFAPVIDASPAETEE